MQRRYYIGITSVFNRCRFWYAADITPEGNGPAFRFLGDYDMQVDSVQYLAANMAASLQDAQAAVARVLDIGTTPLQDVMNVLYAENDVLMYAGAQVFTAADSLMIDIEEAGEALLAVLL